MKLQNTEIRLEPTNMCNSRCVMCPREKMTRKQGIMSFDLFKKVVDQAVPMGAEICSIENYGEPFLDQGLLEKAEYAKEAGLKTLTISNGSLITAAVADEAVKVFDRIRISFYGVSQATYEDVMQGLAYITAYEHLEYLLFKSSCQIEVYYLELPNNDHETARFIRRYESRARIAVWRPHNWIDGRDYRALGGPKKSCGRPATGPLQVLWDGRVSACCWDYNGELIVGDLNKQTVEEVLTSEAYNAVREAHRTKNFKNYICDQCDQLRRYPDALIYTNIPEAKYGKTNTGFDKLI